MSGRPDVAAILADKREWLHVLRVDLVRLEALPEHRAKAIRVAARRKHVAWLEGMVAWLEGIVVLRENAARVTPGGYA